MTAPPDLGDLPDDEAMAAELAVGTLDREERAAAERRQSHDPAFAALVQGWTDRLAPLLDTIEPVDPPPALLGTILAQLRRRPGRFGSAPDRHVVQLRRQVTVWRATTAAALALAAALAVWIGLGREPSAGADRTYMAVLQKGDAGPAFLVSLDLKQRRMTVMPATAPATGDHSLELWMITSSVPAPRSLGLIDASAPVRTTLPDVGPAQISDATYAVTLEPKGGSPTGQPTSAPILIGRLVEEPR